MRKRTAGILKKSMDLVRMCGGGVDVRVRDGAGGEKQFRSNGWNSIAIPVDVTKYMDTDADYRTLMSEMGGSHHVRKGR